MSDVAGAAVARMGVLISILASACAPALVFRPTSDGSPIAPIIRDPKPGAVIVDVRPPITLALAPGTDGARVELCADRACAKVVAELDTRGSKGVAPKDLETGEYWLRVRGRAGSVVGRPGPSQRLFLELRTELKGKRVVVEGPREAKASLARLVTLADRLVERISSFLAIDLPSRPLRLAFYATDAGFEHISKELRGEPIQNAVGVAQQGYSYIRWQGRLRREIVDGVGELEVTLAHELIHQLQQVALQWYSRQPPWLSEGLAELLSELFLEELSGVSSSNMEEMRCRHGSARVALERGGLVPMGELLRAERELFHQGRYHENQILYYSQAYGLLRSLWATDAGRLRDFVRTVSRFEDGIAWRIRHRLGALFGQPEVIGRGLEQWLRASPSLCWRESGLELRVLRDGGLHFQAVDGLGVALGAFHGAEARIELEVELGARTRWVDLLFGCDAKSNCGRVRYYRDGAIKISKELGNKWVVSTRAPGVFPSIATRRRIAIVLDKEEVAVLVNGYEAARAAIDTSRGHQFAITLWEGSVTIRDLRLLGSGSGSGRKPGSASAPSPIRTSAALQ